MCLCVAELTDHPSHDRNRHIFHYIVEDQITYLCMADDDLKRRVPFLFLEDMKVLIKPLR